MKIALLTMTNQSDMARKGEIPLERALDKADISFEWIEWNRHVDWSDYDIALVRTTWDYQAHYEQFLSRLEKIDQSSCLLLNNLKIIKWNSDKNYLFELEEKGVPIVPTKKLKDLPLDEAFNYFEVREVIVKPTVSASAHNTFLLSFDNYKDYLEEINRVSQVKELLIQPKIESVIEEGEFSLHFFAGEHSHTILKKPKEGDFRSQEEYGSHIIPVSPETELMAAARFALEKCEIPLYARVDLVRGPKHWYLMELELIEPCLYFDMDSEAADRLVRKLKEVVS